MADRLASSTWHWLNGAGEHRAARKILDFVPVAATLAVLAAVLVRSVPALGSDIAEGAHALWFAGALVLSLEYLARLWCAPAAPMCRGGAATAYFGYAGSFLGLADLAAIAPFWLWTAQAMPEATAQFVSLLAICKLGRLLPGLRVLATVFRAEARALVSALVALIAVLLVSSGAMFLLERHAQPEVFTSIPAAMWWGIVTIASVGYGDMAPVTAWGRVFGGAVIVVGLSTVAVPVGILANGFYRELRKHDFIVTWKTVAEVALFKDLDSSRIAEIARVLKPQIVPEHQVVVRRGEPARAMFFILDGAVEVDVQPNSVRLGKGQYFGEIALVHDIPRTATVTTVAESSFLVLDVADFRRLTVEYPDIRASIERVAAARRGEASSA